MQVMDSRKELYNGSWVADNARAEMTSVCLNRKPSHCNYLSGLLELYRNKVSQRPIVYSQSPKNKKMCFSLLIAL